MEFLLTSTSGEVEKQIPNTTIKKYTKREVRTCSTFEEFDKRFSRVEELGFLKELITKHLKVEYKENSRTVQRGILSKSIR